ncbi:MAG TPA: DUF389 domain-containing protein [Anaerolineales bacterium]|nr:DUF389 domain-containing protein [Anaerolineales bacterium]
MDYTESSSQPSPDPSQDFVSARAKRRRAQRRAYFPADDAGRNALFEHLARRAFPSYELFVFSLVAGVFLGIGYFFNAQALLIFGILVAPLLTPWIGMSLAIIAGSGRLFAQTITALLLSSLLIFGSGLLAGFASRALPDSARTFNEAFNHSRLWWPNLIMLTAGALILTISFVRSEERPYLPSALLASQLLPPVCAAGFGLGSGVTGMWPEGALVFLVHFAWATFFGIIMLFFLRFYPISFGGATFTGFAIIAILAIATFLTGLGQQVRVWAGLATPEPVANTLQGALVTQTEISPSVSLSTAPSPTVEEATLTGLPTATATRTPTPTRQATARPTETSTVTAEPTPIIGLIKASEGGGAFIRERPGGKVLATLPNGATVTIVPNDLQDVNKVIWVHVFALVNDVRVDGWMMQTVLVTATPVPDWQPSPTPSVTSTP